MGTHSSWGTFFPSAIAPRGGNTQADAVCTFSSTTFATASITLVCSLHYWFVMTNHLSKEIHILDCLFSILSFVICCLSDYSSKDFVTKYTYSSSTESSSSSIQAFRVLLSMYSKQYVWTKRWKAQNQKLGTQSGAYTSSWSHAVQHLYSYLGTKNNHGMTQLAYGHVTAVKNIHMYIKMANLITHNAKVSKKWRKTLLSWGVSHSETGHPTQPGIQAHDHVQYDTFTQIWAQKTIMEWQLTYDHVMVVKNIHIHIKWCTWLPTIQGSQKMKENPKLMRHFSPSVWGYKEEAPQSGQSQQVNRIDWHRDSQ
jgi:hypothetical protein